MTFTGQRPKGNDFSFSALTKAASVDNIIENRMHSVLWIPKILTARQADSGDRDRAEKERRQMRKQVFSLLVDNNPGVLSRISGLFSRRGYSIDSITAGMTADPRYTRITVVSSGDELILEQIEKQVRKLEDVVDIKVLKDGESVFRELALVKLRANAAQRGEIISVADIFRAKIVDVEEDSLMIELTGTQSKLEAFLNLLKDYEILELARTGITGLSRGSRDVKYL